MSRAEEEVRGKKLKKQAPSPISVIGIVWQRCLVERRSHLESSILVMNETNEFNTRDREPKLEIVLFDGHSLS